MDTLYSSRVGATPNQTAQTFNMPQVQPIRMDPARQWSDPRMGLQPLPANFGGGGSVPTTLNANPDIQNQTSQMPPQQSLADQIGGAPQVQGTMPDESAAKFQNEQTMGDAGLLPVKMPSDPTNGQKEYTPEGVKTGSEAITFGMQNSLPPPQSPVQAQTQAADHDRMQTDIQAVAAAKNPKTAWKELKQDPFYKNSDFYTGLMNVGLAIMSGANPMQAFQAGKGAMDKATLSTQLGQNRQALIDAGYSPASIEAAITSGDQSKLQMQQMSDADRLQAEDARWAKQANYANDLEQARYERNRADTLQDQQFQRQTQLDAQAASDQRYAQRQAAALQNQKDMVQYRLKAKQDAQLSAAGSAANGFTFDGKSIANEMRPVSEMLKQHNYKQQQLDQAMSALEEAKQKAKAGDSAGSRAAYLQYVNYAARGEAGPGRSLQADDASHFVEDPSVLVKKGNELSIKAGWSPTDASFKFADANVNTAKGTEMEAMKRRKQQRVRSLVESNPKQWTPEKATAFVNQVWETGENVDPYNLYEKAGNSVDASQGALSSADLNGF